MTLPITMTVVLLALAGLHALWGFGIWFPYRDEAQLARTFVGARDVTRMPGPIPCFLVTGALLLAVLAIWADWGWLQWLIAALFLLRGVLAYIPLWRRMTPELPFAIYDRRYYGPLCLALWLGFLTLAGS